MLALLFIIVSLLLSCKSSLINIETSSFGLRASSQQELQAWLLKFYLKPQDRHLFYAILKSRYYDYFPVLNSICEAVEDARLYEIISDLKLNHFSDVIVADCICLSAKNGPWKDLTSFPVNPIISRRFKAIDWSLEQLRSFLQSSLTIQSHETRWEALLKDNPPTDRELFPLYFEESDNLWRTIQSQSVQAGLVKNIVQSLVETTDSTLLICKVILIGSIKAHLLDDSERSVINVIFRHLIQMNESSELSIVMMLNKLLLHVTDGSEGNELDSLFLKDVLRAIEPVSSPAIILNFMDLFSEQVEQDRTLFEQGISAFFHGRFLIPTIQETCSLIGMANVPSRIETIITEKLANVLHSVYLECHESIPHQIIRKHVPFQYRLETTLRKYRKLVDQGTLIHLKIPPPSAQLPREKLNYLVKQLEVLHKKELHGFKAYNYPVVVYGALKKSFVVAIDYFFDSFLECDSFYHVIEEDASIIPNLINVNPKLLETFGYFMASSIILQHPLKFRLNRHYFSLMRSTFKPQFNHFLFGIYPASDLELVSWKILAEHLKTGVVNLYSGYLKAFEEVDHFSLNELYKLL